MRGIYPPSHRWGTEEIPPPCPSGCHEACVVKFSRTAHVDIEICGPLLSKELREGYPLTNETSQTSAVWLADGQTITDADGWLASWAKYFEQFWVSHQRLAWTCVVPRSQGHQRETYNLCWDLGKRQQVFPVSLLNSWNLAMNLWI